MKEAKIQFYSDLACDNRSVTLVTGWLFLDYLDAVTFPLLFLACIAGSILVIVITHRRVAESKAREWFLTSAIICVLAVSDMVGMVFEGGQFAINVQDFVDSRPRSDLLRSLEWNMLQATMRWGREASLTLSNWLLICFSVERIISLRPSRMNSLVYLDSVKGGAACTLLVLLCYAAISPLPYLVDDTGYYVSEATNLTYHQPDWLRMWLEVQFYHEIIFISGTFFTLSCSALGVYRLLKSHQEEQKHLAQQGLRKHLVAVRKPSNGSSSISTGATRALIGCLFLYFFTQSPVVVRNIVIQLDKNCVFNIPGVDKKNSETIVVLIARLNFALDFFIYLVVDRKFRQHAEYLFLEMLGRVEDRKTRRKKKLLKQLSDSRSTSSGSSLIPNSPSPSYENDQSPRFIMEALLGTEETKKTAEHCCYEFRDVLHAKTTQDTLLDRVDEWKI
ncbi:hypothetical protein BV898_10597 [Hypsibius exemplaris]|uniref:G-protein coupled receptors family 1 profile domain-containing protein n=1 Tax=Hypsibius exemplaris TaxID=2072580 RepID=A0A1W0WJA8_HYPEX|nr:hypothetical protein BV898_10597 [Hypsibius exemplaris]